MKAQLSNSEIFAALDLCCHLLKDMGDLSSCDSRTSCIINTLEEMASKYQIIFVFLC